MSSSLSLYNLSTAAASRIWVSHSPVLVKANKYSILLEILKESGEYEGQLEVVMMLRDMVVRGAVVGLLADIVKLILNYVAFQLGFTNVVFWQIAAARLLQKGQLQSPAALFVGAVVDLTTAAALGTVFLWVVDNVFGRRVMLFKGIAFGLLTWLSLLGSLGSTLEQKLPQSLSGIIVTIFAHAAFGLALAYFAQLIDVPERENR